MKACHYRIPRAFSTPFLTALGKLQQSCVWVVVEGTPQPYKFFWTNQSDITDTFFFLHMTGATKRSGLRKVGIPAPYEKRSVLVRGPDKIWPTTHFKRLAKHSTPQNQSHWWVWMIKLKLWCEFFDFKVHLSFVAAARSKACCVAIFGIHGRPRLS